MMPSVKSSFLRRSGVWNARANAVSTVPPAPPAVVAREVTVLRIDRNDSARHLTGDGADLETTSCGTTSRGRPADIPGAFMDNELRQVR